MNTVKSFWIGWGSLIVAGGGAYYFAKQQINADRREKHLRRLQQQQYNDSSSYIEHDNAGSPAREAGGDPAATRHEPQTEDEALREKGKYEASITYQSRRGDRFS